MIRYICTLLLLFLLTATKTAAQDEEIFMTIDAGPVVNYVPWSSFQKFREEYNTTNAETLKNNLGGLSWQYGYSVGVDCFVANHLYSGVDYYYAHSSASAKFENDSRRIMKSDINTITVFIGWLQAYEKSYWTLTTGLNASFGTIHSYLQFPDGTRYVHTSGLSGEFHDVAIGLPLKFEWTRNLSARTAIRIGGQFNAYGRSFNLGMQNSFTTVTTGAIALNEKQVNFDIMGGSVFFGIAFKIVQQ